MLWNYNASDPESDLSNASDPEKKSFCFSSEAQTQAQVELLGAEGIEIGSELNDYMCFTRNDITDD